jgi:hypothetical protein
VLAITAALAVVLVGGWTGLWAAFFPTWTPTVIWEDDFETDLFSPPTRAYRIYRSPLAGYAPNWDYFTVDTVDQVENGMWGDYYFSERDTAEGGKYSVAVISKSVLGEPGHDPTEWDNIRIDVDISGVDGSAIGVAWGLTDNDANPTPSLIEGYYFYIDNLPTAAEAMAGDRAQWHLVKQVGGIMTEIGSAPLVLDDADPDLLTMVGQRANDYAYRMRLEFFCNNLRVQMQRLVNPAPGDELYLGCGGDATTDPEARWCTVTEWLEPGARLTPGMVGLYSSGDTPGSTARNRFDNLKVSSWTVSCEETCSEWFGWVDTTTTHWDVHDAATADEKIERLELKYLYDAALHDYGGVNRDIQGRVDNDVDLTLAQACDGWSLAVDLPLPSDPGGENIPEIRAFLEPMASAVNLINDSGCGTGVLGSDNLCFESDFDNDPESVDYNPIPIVTFGSTPIEASLEDAYDWYVAQRTEGGDWFEDPLAECRRWYMILITDGQESGVCSPEAFGADCTAASEFANPELGLDRVPIFTIGFAGGFTVDGESPVKCLSDATGGEFRVAADAAELAAVLEDVINRLDERDRSFVPFKVSPPPSSQGGRQDVRDFLAVFPFFVPREGRSVWPGTLYAFALNREQPRLPTTGACAIDFDQVLWDANESLTAQVMAADPERNVFIGVDTGAAWQRRDLADIRGGGDEVLRGTFRTLLDWPVAATDLQVQEVVNFLRYEWVDNDEDGGNDGPQHPPIAGVSPGGRPSFNIGLPTEEPTSALGDIYHSQPRVVNPPNTSMFFYDYGFVAPGERGAHNYQDFMLTHAKRRRVVLAGANDGMLHAFDAGFHDRDEDNYDDQHDLGTGDELFAYVPNAVIGPRLRTLTYGDVQDYLVDGPITVSDAFISPDGGTAEREWRTVALATMRRGGRGVVALDITQPDPIDADFAPTLSVLPGCTTTADGDGCNGQYPNVLWEFSDEADDNANGRPDLGFTWSQPAVARIAVENGDNPDDLFIAFFGGGWDRSETDATGTYVYGVDIETGDMVYKYPIGVAVPGGFTALDSNLDGFHDRVYFGDTDGGIWRLAFAAPTEDEADGIVDGELTGVTPIQIFDLSDASDLRQQFYPRPVTVPVVFDGGSYEWALAIGSGDRANLQDRSAVVEEGGPSEANNFFFLLDVGDTTTRNAADLTPVSYVDLGGEPSPSGCEGVNALNPPDSYGWFLSLRANEKVNFEATVINGHVLFPTFEATDEVVDSPPDLCSGGEPPEVPTPEPTAVPTPGETPTPSPDTAPICSAAGIGRAYDLWFQCGQGEETALNDIITGVEDYTIDGITYVTFTVSEAQPGMTEEFVNITGYAASNWRQD